MRLSSLVIAASMIAASVPAIAAPLPSAAPSAACKPKGKKEGDAASRKKKKTPKADEAAAEAPPEEKEAAPAAAPAANGAKAADEEGRALQRGERVEFDARLIQGQAAKAGAVYLFARVPTNLKSMVRERTTFREKIVRTVYPTEEEAP